MANTTNFGWETPDNTDLVKDGALAIRTLGSAIDTSLVDLKGGTTGQILSKASNTDMDFSWVAQDDSNAIQNAIVDAKGDLITATAADTPARLAVGTNNQVLTADSTTATGLKWASVLSGGMTLLGSGTLSGSTVTLSSISADYVDLVIYLNGIVQSTTSLCSIRLNNSTTNISGTNIYSTTLANNTFGSVIPVGSSDASLFMNSTGHNAFAFTITNYADAVRKAIRGFGGYKYSTDTNQIAWHFYGSSTDTTAYDRVDIVTGSGTFSAGTYEIYGVK